MLLLVVAGPSAVSSFTRLDGSAFEQMQIIDSMMPLLW